MEERKDDRKFSPGGPNANDIFASEDTINKLMDKVEGVEPGHKSGLHSSLMRIILVVNFVLVLGVLVYLAIFHSKPAIIVEKHVVEPAAKPTEPAKQADEQAGITQASTSKDPVAATLYAQELYDKGEYEKARICYGVLKSTFTAEGPTMRPLADYMQFKIALCQLRLNRQSDAGRLLAECASSASPVVSVMSNYRMAVMDLGAERYASARTRLYNSIALVGALPEELQPSLEKECAFLLADATARRFWQVTGSRPELPTRLLERAVIDDPAAKLGYDELTQFVCKGAELFAPAPVVAKKEDAADKALSRWNIVARNVPVYDLLTELGTKAAFGLKWEAAESEKSRQVTVRLVEKSPDAATEIIAGCAGMMSGVKNGIPSISNPESALLKDQQKRVYSTESVALLNRFILLYTKDDAAPAAYFLAGLIHEQTGAQTAAISDYKIIASRYPSSHLVQYALWNSSKIKLSLKDTAAARADLEQIMELNDSADGAIQSQATMKLAQLVFAAGQYKDADKLFRKVYTMNPTAQMQAAAALGAARSLFASENNFEASEWYTRYIQLEKNKKSAELFDAGVDLGVCFRRMDKLKQSAEALRFALARELTADQRMKGSIELARTEIEAESYVKAMAALQNLPVTPNLTDDEVTVLLLNSKVYSEIGMPEKAAIAIQNAIDRAYSKERAACLADALAEAYVAMGSADKAADALARIRDSLQPSARHNELTCALAEIDVTLGRNTEAIALATGLLSLKPGDDIMDRSFRAIGRAYTNMKQYDKAALAYAGRISADGGSI
jgi:tetratricopeptide (TPR) repeat protein